jgi:hypothetical protein
MAVFIDSVSFKNEFRPEATYYLLGNIGDKIEATIDFTVKTVAFATTDNPIIVNATDGYIGDGWCISTNGAWAGFMVGDTVRFFNLSSSSTAVFTIVQKLSDDEVQFNMNFSATSDNTELTDCVFSVTTPITGMKYFHNLVENNDQPNFFSLATNQQMLHVHQAVDGSSTTALPMTAQGDLEWQIGEVEIAGISITTTPVHETKFTLTHTFYITPFFLAAQWDDLLQGTAPVYNNDAASLKYIYRIEAMYDFNDPNRIQVVQVDDILGNTGWFDENFNQTPTKYYVDSVVFTRADSTVIPQLELTQDETTVEIVIKNTIDNPFVDGSTKFCLNFVKAPEDESEYQNNGLTLDANFLLDRRLNTVGAAALNGEQFGTTRQVLKDVEAVFNSASEILITAKVALSADIVSELADLDNKRYIMWVTVQDHSLATDVADRVSLLLSATDFYEDFSDDAALNSVTNFLRHPHSIPAELVGTFTGFPEDELVGVTTFHVDKTDFVTGDTLELKRLDIKIKAKNSVTAEQFYLSKYKFDFSQTQYVNGNQFVNYPFDRNYHIPHAEPRRNIWITRELLLDTATKFYYKIYYPFMIRWEKWKALTSVNGDFFNQNQPNNGFNHFWQRYQTVANWGLYYEFILTASKNGHTITHTEEVPFEVEDYDSNPDWNPNGIKAYDNVTNTLLYNATTQKNHIYGYADTRIEAEFTQVSGTPDLNMASVVMGIEVFEEGGELGRRRLTSAWPSDGDTWFKSIDISDRVVLSLNGNTVKATCLVDFTKLPINKQKFKITARIYSLDGEDLKGGKITEDGDWKLTENVLQKIIE